MYNNIISSYGCIWRYDAEHLVHYIIQLCHTISVVPINGTVAYQCRRSTGNQSAREQGHDERHGNQDQASNYE